MRRVLRKIAIKEEKELGDLSTLSDPEVVKTLIGEPHSPLFAALRWPWSALLSGQQLMFCIVHFVFGS